MPQDTFAGFSSAAAAAKTPFTPLMVVWCRVRCGRRGAVLSRRWVRVGEGASFCASSSGGGCLLLWLCLWLCLNAGLKAGVGRLRDVAGRCSPILLKILRQPRRRRRRQIQWHPKQQEHFLTSHDDLLRNWGTFHGMLMHLAIRPGPVLSLQPT